MEPWDGPAFISYSDGETIGARLDRNGFRPCRWTITDDHFYLCSEAGSFNIPLEDIVAKGTLHAGSGVTVDLRNGAVHFEDPSRSRENYDAKFDPRLLKIDFSQRVAAPTSLEKKNLFNLTEEEFEKILVPMITDGKEPIGSMGDTARPAILSNEPRSFFDYFYHDFAQVTNPPLDYLREQMVTDLLTFVGRRPNIFAPKELIPPAVAVELSSPVLSLGQMHYFARQVDGEVGNQRIVAKQLSMTFQRVYGSVGFRSALSALAADACAAVEAGATVIILSDRDANVERPPIPSLLALRAVVNALNREGISLEASLIIDTAEVRSTHQLAALISFGATAVCPYLAMEIARFDQSKSLSELDPDQKEKNLQKVFEAGLLKIMSKMGISVVRSYQNSQLFTALGVGQDILGSYFQKLSSPIGGIGIDQLVADIIRRADAAQERGVEGKLINTYQFKEHNKGTVGEKHSMTNARSKQIHRIVKEKGIPLESMELFDEYLRSAEVDEPVNLRHLLEVVAAEERTPLERVQSAAEILRTFGSGAMSFGAISAEAQRDIIEAMRIIDGRSNSGEGGENPYYYVTGATATTKQVASGRFGVTAEYLVTGRELQIKIAQGAKPGEGGQLMGVKVSAEIARARHSNMNVDLISPPPLHDIYSIEDLKELIYALKQLNPEAMVNVKLVSGANIGTIAVGVAKAGADSIHIAGHDGGTGAAPLSSMKHAGLPWEIGLVEVHRALDANNLRTHVKLRVDGGLQTGKDILLAAILGADEFDFGKLLLVAQGCVMARICEKNTCPTGIATHDPKFKAKYKGTPEAIVTLLSYLAEDVRRQLSAVGLMTLSEAVGRGDLLIANHRCSELIQARRIDLQQLLLSAGPGCQAAGSLIRQGPSALNAKLLDDARASVEGDADVEGEYEISTYDRAALATLSGALAKRIAQERMAVVATGQAGDTHGMVFGGKGRRRLRFNGSAGQGFGVFLTAGTEVTLYGEANDSVCKSMSGGQLVILPPKGARFEPHENTIIGNCALYGATGGSLFVHGRAGDRFAVRNSGALAVVEGTGLHACEYMTNGTVVILGSVSHNVGAGMTGGMLFLLAEYERFVNLSYLKGDELSPEESNQLQEILRVYVERTGSAPASKLLSNWDEKQKLFRCYLPIAEAKKRAERSVPKAIAQG